MEVEVQMQMVERGRQEMTSSFTGRLQQVAIQ